MAGLDVRTQRGGVVATHFVDTRAERCCAVVVACHDIGIPLESALEIRAYGTDENHEHILRSGFYAHLRTASDEQRTQVECGSALVRRNELLVQLHDFLHHLEEQVGGHLGHHHAACRRLQSLRILLGTKHAHLAVGTAERLQSLESLLTIVQAGCGHVDTQIFAGANFNFAPLSVAMVAADVVVGWHVAKWEFFPF